MSRLVLILILSLTNFGVSLENSISSRSILRAIDDKDDVRDFAVDLNITNFDAVLGDTPATYAIVEFFAHWCPACRNYKPHYEKVARLFNGPDSVHPGIILMTRVDCALKINSKLCEYFSVGHYPMLLWGPPSKFVSSSWGPKQDKSGVVLIDDGRTADRLLSWINKQLDRSYGLDDGKFQNDHSSNISDIEQIVRAVYDVEEATSTALDIILENKMINPNTRASLLKFLQLLVAHHPSRRCRKGSADILVNFDEFYPSGLLSSNTLETVGNGKATLGNIPICGKEVPRGYWMFCRGSKNETRGFSCGLWVLLHSLSVRIDDGESQFAFAAMCDFIHNFFICEECRQHFYQMCSSVSTSFNTTRDFALWLWSAHNEVNERLMKDEAAFETGDPKFPKLMWPQKQLCPSCSLSTNPNKNDETSRINWDRDEVFKFLSNYYGKKLVSLNKDRSLLGNAATLAIAEDSVGSTNALAVPLGAALAIGISSCAFGALACYWRSHQKNRKYFHHLHSLKNI